MQTRRTLRASRSVRQEVLIAAASTPQPNSDLTPVPDGFQTRLDALLEPSRGGAVNDLLWGLPVGRGPARIRRARAVGPHDFYFQRGRQVLLLLSAGDKPDRAVERAAAYRRAGLGRVDSIGRDDLWYEALARVVALSTVELTPKVETWCNELNDSGLVIPTVAWARSCTDLLVLEVEGALHALAWWAEPERLLVIADFGSADELRDPERRAQALIRLRPVIMLATELDKRASAS